MTFLNSHISILTSQMTSSDRPHLIEMIRTEQREYDDRKRKAGVYGVADREPGRNLFKLHSANKWLEMEQNTPMPKMLFGEFWYEGELCILFADTNAGKSVLAVQIGNALARKEQIYTFPIEADKPNVVYLDFELSGKQFQSRYSENQLLYQFEKNFYRAEYNAGADMPFDFKTFDDYMNSAIEYTIKKTQANVLIIDNITSLRRGTEQAHQALPLMKHLKALKTKYNLSILVLAHTPKRNAANPITRNDLQGSKMLINFADSAFAIGESYRQKGLRYLKQVKQRNTHEVYGADNVCLCRIVKPINFLHFEFEGHAPESLHLNRPSYQERQLLIKQVNDLAAQGLSYRQISAKMNIGLATVNRMMNAEKDEGKQGASGSDEIL